MKVPVKVISNETGRVVEGTYTARRILDMYEEELVDDLTKCDCEPIGETNVVDCSCYEEWEDYQLLIGDEITE